MKHAIALATAVLSCAISGCGQVSKGSSDPSYTASFKVEAEQCTTYCRFVIVRLRVENTGNEVLCVPSVYSDSSGSAALNLTDQASGEPINLTRSYDPDRFHSIRYRDDMLDFFDLPQTVVQPGSHHDFRLTFDGDFELRNQSADAMLRLVAFRCRATSAKPDAKFQDLRSEVVFH
ncbi:MAG: hypothetical protein ACK4MH_02470 [Brevundimonas sp.]|uniref:hypothetical protein n=1 Tax=Brevundimonas sp. TaxID=1871086 RepID=UPI00391BACEA